MHVCSHDCRCCSNLTVDVVVDLASNKSLSRLKKAMVHLIVTSLAKEKPLKIGGQGIIVQADESAFAKRKVCLYNMTYYHEIVV